MIATELRWQAARPRTWLTLSALALFSVALTIALAASGAGETQRVGDIPLLIRPSSSGVSIPVIALSSTMKFFLPLAVAIFAGECVAGEAGWGSLRYALCGPGSRARLLGRKLAVALSFSALAVALVPLSAAVAGVVAFGWHPFAAIDGSGSTPLHDTVIAIGQGDALGRLGLATLYVGAGMASIFAFSFLASTITSRAFAAVAAGVGLTIVSRVLNGDYLPGVASISKYMPNNDVDLWQHLLQTPAQTAGMGRFLVLQVVYVTVCLSLAWWWFTRKDVLD